MVAVVHALVADAAVLAERDLAQQVVAQRVGAVELDGRAVVHGVAARLRHAVAVLAGEHPVDEELVRQLVAGREQHRGPDHRVEAQDVLAEQLPARRPQARGQVLAGAGVRERGGVVDERVDPDVDRLVGIPRQRHAPVDGLARDRDVLQAALDVRAHLVEARLRQHERRIGGVAREQRIGVGREAEERVALLRELRHGAVLGAAAVDQVVLACRTPRRRCSRGPSTCSRRGRRARACAPRTAARTPRAPDPSCG